MLGGGVAPATEARWLMADEVDHASELATEGRKCSECETAE